MTETDYIDGLWADDDTGLWCDQDLPLGIWFPDNHGQGALITAEYLDLNFQAIKSAMRFIGEYQDFNFKATNIGGQ